MSQSVAERTSAFGRQLRLWRQARGLSQLALAADAGLSQRHLSFIETGRARPGGPVIHRISEALNIPLRERNRLYENAGLPPIYPELPLDSTAIAPFREAIQRMLATHDPYPAYVVNRWWDIVETNRAGRLLFPYDLTEAPNAVDAFLAPGPMREMLDNFDEVAPAFVARLRLEAAECGTDERLHRLVARAEAHLAETAPPGNEAPTLSELVICPRLRIGDRLVRTLSMVARFSQAREITVDELRVELIYPQDEAAEAFFRSLAAAP